MSTDPDAVKSAAIANSHITRVIDRVDALMKQILAELGATPDRFRDVWSQRWAIVDSLALEQERHAAAQECAAAGIPFTEYDPAFEAAIAVYQTLYAFKTAPEPPHHDWSLLAGSEDAVLPPEGYHGFDAASQAAYDRVVPLRRQVMFILGRLQCFRNASVAAAHPEVCLPRLQAERLPKPEESPDENPDKDCTEPKPHSDGPFLRGCFRYRGREMSGIGGKQWLLLAALWGKSGPLEKVTVEAAHRAVYGRKRLNRNNLRNLWNKLNAILWKLRIGYKVDPTQKGGDELRLQPVAIRATTEDQSR